MDLTASGARARHHPATSLIAGHLAVTTFHYAAERFVSPSGWLRYGDEMLFRIALGLLLAWLLGVIGLYRVGDLVHALLLVGLMLLLLAFVTARDAAAGRGTGSSPEK